MIHRGGRLGRNDVDKETTFLSGILGILTVEY